MILVRPIPDRKALRGTASLSNSQTLFFNISTFVNLAPLTSRTLDPCRAMAFVSIFNYLRFLDVLFTIYLRFIDIILVLVNHFLISLIISTQTIYILGDEIGR